MSLETTIMTDLKAAMKSKDRTALETLRAIKTALLNEKTAAGATEIDEVGAVSYTHLTLPTRIRV